MPDRNTSIHRSQLKPIRYDDFDATNSPSDGQVAKYDEVTGKFTWIAVGEADKIKDADNDTKIQVEESADEDHIRMDVAGAEAFDLDNDGILTLVKNSYCRVYRATTAQTISTGSFVKVEFNAEEYDIQSEFDSNTNYRFTAKKAGSYIINAHIEWASPEADKRFIIAIYVNGSSVAWQDCVSGAITPFGQAINDIITLGINDYVEIFVRNYATGDETITASSITTYLSIAKMN
jgi:hypothetical protein